jgi:uncharacterized protein (DUF885 family)
LTWLQLAGFQPVGTAELRSQAIARWNKMPVIVSTEIQNLRTGISEGYTMPKEIVQVVIDQFQRLLSYKLEESPFYSPAKRDSDTVFKKKWTVLLTDKVFPALRNYHDFLKTEYLPKTREDVSLLSIPHGSECYEACIRERTTTNKTGEEIFELGQALVSTNKKAVEKLGNELYGVSNFSEIIKRLDKDSTDSFKTSNEIIAFDSFCLDKAEKECHKWFNLFPSASVTIKPYAAHESGVGSYEEATINKPAYCRINLNDPASQNKGANELLIFHETYPGHHLQVGIQKDLKDIHPVSKLTFFGSYDEGWARYGEQLAEEMGLYQSETASIRRRTRPGRGMVVDVGLHLKDWTKEQVINYMRESGWSDADALNLYYRAIVWPGQLTSYDTGGEEIKALRKMAEDQLGINFDIKEFHKQILQNGSIPLGLLREQVTDWLETQSK